jgi:RNA 2',3'-cyclic 3'-phosphodiesterase
VRLFIALNFPDPVRRDLWDAIEPLRDAPLPVKWVRPEGIHLTLKFLGPVPDPREPELRAALSPAARGIRPLPLAIGGFGAFPHGRAPRVIWAGLEALPALELLQHQVEREFAPLGFPTEARAFHPHVTLGRAARDARASEFAGLEPVLAGLHFEATAVVETVDLMQSVLQSGGATYQVRHRERLS